MECWMCCDVKLEGGFWGSFEDLAEVNAPKRAELHEVTWSTTPSCRIAELALDQSEQENR